MTLRSLLLGALTEMAGAAVVLDPRLRIVERTQAALALTGSPLTLGALAPKLLCGESGARPIAEALAAGRAGVGRLTRLGEDGRARVLVVRAVPLGTPPEGWLLVLTPEPTDMAGEGAVSFHGIRTRDPRMKALFADITKVALADSSVVIRGETGSGKELVAAALHAESGRRSAPFRALNCAALPAQLLESELFGHARGAFTGAVRDYEGHFRMAHRGTLFLDEVAELPLEIQAKLLRVLQERTVLPLGGRDPIPVDVRVLAATHRSLRAEVAAGRFRADLMYRLRVIPLFLPALRERAGDIELLSHHFISQLGARGVRVVKGLSPGALAALARYPWPGNVRELMNAIEYAFVMGTGELLTEDELPPEIRGEEPGAIPLNDGPSDALQDLPSASELPKEARRLLQALERAGGSRERAAKSLGISRSTLWRRLQRYGLGS
ncbi:MAG: sigma 54-interacting transcriptional regulator [Polyangiaceae bacterium]|nr:sigma 54-interacting transcriptional regulator [Polyangiaceae bacterium]